MKILGPTPLERLNEAVGLVCLAAALALTLSLISYQPLDPSWNTASGAVRAHNLIGQSGAWIADLLLQTFGLASYLLPAFLTALAWKWIRSSPIDAQWAKICGAVLLGFSTSSMLSMGNDWGVRAASMSAGGVVGSVFASWLLGAFNLTGAVLVCSTSLLLSLYLISTFSLRGLPEWLMTPLRGFQQLRAAFGEWRESMRRRSEQRAAARQQEILRRDAARGDDDLSLRPRRRRGDLNDDMQPVEPRVSPLAPGPDSGRTGTTTDVRRRTELYTVVSTLDDEIPIRTLDGAGEDEHLAAPTRAGAVSTPPFEPTREPAVVEYVPPPPAAAPAAARAAVEPMTQRTSSRPLTHFVLPSTELLNAAEARTSFDTDELKTIAGRIKSKFEEFNVLGNITQINPGPVVTTFEFKPEAGIKYSRITTLTEDLCLGLQAESILIERIPGKPTVGIEVPNSKREVIALRQILESDEFLSAPSKLTIALGKDISGRIRVAQLEQMPHLLIAGSTGSGKSVMLNSLIMSVLYKSTPHEVRMVLIDPKRVEMGMYEGVPHLLTPVITDPRKATNALRNAVAEMERRLKLLASQGVRNIDQFNKKIKQKLSQPRSLFEDSPSYEEELQPLPFILIVIDELADLMMLEKGNVEESVTRLAQMARAVGMHLVVATQRPSVDVITGLIKANFPARISFRVATRVDSRTILDVMGAEHLLGKGDMLHLPPGSARLTRVHAAYVTENEICGVVDCWKAQGQPEYDESYLMAPPADDAAVDGGDEEFQGAEDPAYQDAVRVVLEVGKASTSILQRRLRLGYGRAARLLDMMQKEGIIGPPDGSRPREVLKRPDWLDEIDKSLR
ncbi:MAG TPA: DNA translocase FtsK [Bryobacteraceae bacterium]|nr:DNA translocase FtsK [Bryobacteraceae bacterium]